MAAKRPNQDLYYKISTGANALLVLMALAVVLSYTPLLGKRQLLVWRLAMQSAILAHTSRLLYSVGLPALKPFSIAEIKAWFAEVAKTSDVHYLLVAFMFMAQRPMLPALFSPTLLATLRLAAFAKKGVPSLAATAERISAKQEEAFGLMAFVDILMLPMIIGLAVIRRLSIILPFVYLNLLWHRYHSPAATGAKHHQKVWKEVDTRAQPYIKKAPPQVQRVTGYAQRFFTTPPAAAASKAQARAKEQTAAGKTE